MLSLQLLGSPLVRVDGQTVSHFRSAKSAALLAYLVINRQTRHSRSTLLNLLWPDVPESNARQNLSQTLTRLRDALDAAADLIVANRQAIWVKETAVIDLDLHTFDRLLAEVGQHKHEQTTACADCLAKLTQAVALARGELLAGLEIDDSLAFEEWLLLERERIHQLLLDALMTLAEGGLKNGRYETAIDHARHQIALEPWREIAHRQLIQALALSGRRNAALAQYEACRATLRQELGVEPTQLTQQLATAVRAGAISPAPPSPSRTPIASNLPHQLTPFIGRAPEIASLLAALTAENETRLVTITGPGGIGKTRLAQEIGHALLAQPPQQWALTGIWFVSFIGVNAPDNIPIAIANTLGLTLPSKESAADAVIEQLRPQKIALILDNFEQVVDGRSWLLSLLQAAPHLRLIVTSREHLRLLAEKRFPLQGLATPPADVPHPHALDYDASRLFVDRARRLYPDFRLTAVNWPPIAHICRLIDGLPLGIELAVTLIDDNSPAEIAARISADAATLATDYLDVAPHQRRIELVFEQSWVALSPAEQRALSRLTIFASDRYSSSAARAVAGASRQMLNALARKSFIHSHAPADGYAIHPLYRAFAKRKLPADQTELQQAYVNYFTHLLADAVPAQFDKEKHRRLRDLLPLLPDLRACWHWALATADAELVGALEGTLYRLLREVGLREGLTLFEAAWERLPTAWPENGRTLPQQIVLAHLTTHLGFFRIFSGDTANARLVLEYALAEFDRLHITAGRDTALTALADALVQLGENEARLALWRRELALIAASGDPSRQSLALCNLGDILYQMGQLEEARESFARSLETELVDEPDYNSAIVMNNLGLAELALGNLTEAGRWLQKSLQIREQYPNAYRIGSARLALGMLAIAERDYATARQQLETALVLYTESGRQEKVGLVHLHLSRLALQQGDFADAERQARQALAYAQQFKSVAHELEGLWRWAEVLWATERQDEAQPILAYVLGHPNVSGLLAREIRAFLDEHEGGG